MQSVFFAMATSFGAPERLLESGAVSPAASVGRESAATSPVTGRSPYGRLHHLAMSIFVGLETVAIAFGLMIYLVDPFGFVRPRVALAAPFAMAAIVVGARVLPALGKRVSRTRSLEVVALFLYATSMTLSMGAANSPFIALYALTLLASALLWEPWPVVALAILTLGFTLLQTDYMDLMDEMPLFTTAVVLLNALLPAAVAAAVIALVRKIVVATGVEDGAAAASNSGEGWHRLSDRRGEHDNEESR